MLLFISQALTGLDGVSDEYFSYVAIIVTIPRLNIEVMSQKAKEFCLLDVTLAASLTPMSRNDRTDARPNRRPVRAENKPIRFSSNSIVDIQAHSNRRSRGKKGFYTVENIEADASYQCCNAQSVLRPR